VRLQLRRLHATALSSAEPAAGAAQLPALATATSGTPALAAAAAAAAAVAAAIAAPSISPAWPTGTPARPPPRPAANLANPVHGNAQQLQSAQRI